MIMLRKLKARLRQWLFDGVEPSAVGLAAPPLKMVLDCLVRTRGKATPKSYRVSGVCGLMLVGTCVDDSSTRLVSSAEALDQDHFCRLWQHFSGGARITWADGTPADISSSQQSQRPAQTPVR